MTIQNAQPPVTVLMPAYNAGPYIREAIDSVLRQTFTDFEFLIINDGSTDDTAAILAGYRDARISIVNQENMGLTATLNKGIVLAKGKWIVRFDADDVCYPDRIKRQSDFLSSNPGHVIVGAAADYMDKDGNYLFTFDVLPSDEEIRAAKFVHCPFIHSSVMCLKEAIVKAGGYDTEAYTFEDHLLWRNMADQGKMGNITAPLIKVRFNPESVTIDEKWRGEEFRSIKQHAIENGKLAQGDAERLVKIIAGQNFTKFKAAAYYSMIGKKYLWNQHDPGKARAHLKQAISIMPARKEPYLLYLLSFLPKAVVLKLYNKIKGSAK
ncbi:MAG: glycosyltransferase [Bacteroidota bacterium]